MAYAFGQDFEYRFYPMSDNQTLMNLPLQSPAIYIYTDSSRPSRSQGLAGTGALQSITSWTADNGGYKFTVSAISDPDVNSTIDRRNYWIVINFIAKAAGQTQSVMRTLEMERIGGQHKKINVTQVKIQEYFPTIFSYYEPTQVQAAIPIAINEIKTDLKNKAFEWSGLFRPDYLELMVIYKTLANLMLNQRLEKDDLFDLNHNKYLELYASQRESTRLEYDADRDGIAEQKTESAGFVYLSR